MLNKLMALLILLMLTSVSLADDSDLQKQSRWYFGAAVGTSRLNYEVKKKISQLQAIPGVQLTTNQNLSPFATKIFVGRRFFQNWKAEFAYKHYGTYEEGVSGIASGATGSATGSATATASIDSFSLSALYDVFTWHKVTPYIRLGVEHASVKYDTSSQVSITVVPGHPVITTSHKSLSESGPIPVVGVGLEYPVTRTFSVRGEMERSGEFKHGGIYSDVYTLGIVKHF